MKKTNSKTVQSKVKASKKPTKTEQELAAACVIAGREMLEARDYAGRLEQEIFAIKDMSFLSRLKFAFTGKLNEKTSSEG